MMDINEKLILRLNGLETGLYTVKILIVNGKIILYTEPVKDKIEGKVAGIANLVVE